jgi:hypothetical protein
VKSSLLRRISFAEFLGQFVYCLVLYLRTFFGKKSSVTYPIAILAGSLLVRLPAAGTAKKTSRAAACCSISSQVGPQDQKWWPRRTLLLFAKLLL